MKIILTIFLLITFLENKAQLLCFPMKPQSTIYYRTLTIDHTKCGSSNSSNFAVLVSFTNSTFATTVFGGHVYRSDGFDIEFFSDASHTVLLSWELEFYSASSGIVIARVNIPTVSSSSDLTFYMSYGSKSITSFQGGATGAAYDASTKALYHFSNGTTLSALDATSNGNNGTIVGCTAISGEIDGASSFNGTSQYISTISVASGTAFTLSGWLNPTNPTDAYAPIIVNYSGQIGLFESTIGGGHVKVLNYSDNTTDHFCTTSLTNSVWNYFAVVYNSATTNIKFYLNGALINTISGYTQNPSSLTYTAIGKESALDYWIGGMDDIEIDNTNRGVDWILTSYNNQSSPTTFITLGTETN